MFYSLLLQSDPPPEHVLKQSAKVRTQKAVRTQKILVSFAYIKLKTNLLKNT